MLLTLTLFYAAEKQEFKDAWGGREAIPDIFKVLKVVESREVVTRRAKYRYVQSSCQSVPVVPSSVIQKKSAASVPWWIKEHRFYTLGSFSAVSRVLEELAYTTSSVRGGRVWLQHRL